MILSFPYPGHRPSASALGWDLSARWAGGGVAVVAPRAGAWIETFLLISETSNVLVAPRAGAWIEPGDLLA
jgi:hypothetical protein